MGRPVKWSRDLHSIRERANNSGTETWSRTDLQNLFDVSRASAQSLMKAIGEVQTVGASHFVERTSLLRFLDQMILADSVEDALAVQTHHCRTGPQSQNTAHDFDPGPALRYAARPSFQHRSLAREDRSDGRFRDCHGRGSDDTGDDYAKRPRSLGTSDHAAPSDAAEPR